MQNFFITDQIWSATFYKSIFLFCYSNNITVFKFTIFIINFLIIVNICHFTSTGSILIVLWYVFYNYYHLTYQYTRFFGTEVMYFLYILSLQVLINLSAMADTLNTFLYHSSEKMISYIYCNIDCVYQAIFYLVCVLIHLKFF